MIRLCYDADCLCFLYKVMRYQGESRNGSGETRETYPQSYVSGKTEVVARRSGCGLGSARATGIVRRPPRC